MKAFSGQLSMTQLTQVLQGRSIERAAAVLSVLLALLIAWSLARLTWSLWPLPAQPEAPLAAPLSTAPGNMRAMNANSPRLADLHLFGEAKEQDLAPENAQAAPETQLKLSLSGVLAADDKDSARAIIAGPDGDEKPYAIGDTLPGNAKLKQILVDRVVLQSGGRYETLRLPTDASVLSAPDVAVPAVPAPDLGGDDVAPTPPQSLQQYRQQLLANPAHLLDLIQVIPVSQNGKFQGFRLGPGRNPQFLRRFGLQPGDMVTSVNGITLDDPGKGAQALQTIATASEINVTVRRGGVEQQVRVSLDGQGAQ